MAERCVALIESLTSNHSRVMLPSVVVAEYLTDFPLEQQEAQRRILERNFFIAPFDTSAASIAAQIYCKKVMDQVKDQQQIGRQCIKADYKIIATAIAHKATRIYTNDGHFRSLAVGRIIVEDIPPLPPPALKQADMFLGEQ